METRVITRINEVEILASRDNQYVPIRPICQALGIDPEGQRQKIQRDYFLSRVTCMIKATGKDGKQYDMFAIPYMFVFGWIQSIEESRIDPIAAENVFRFKSQCIKSLYYYITAPGVYLFEKQKRIEHCTAELMEKQEKLNTAKQDVAEAKNQLNKALNYTMEEWEENNRQLKLFPEEPEA